MDYKPHPEKFDFKRDIMCINRTTGRMLLSALTLITPQKRGQQIHDIINDAHSRSRLGRHDSSGPCKHRD